MKNIFLRILMQTIKLILFAVILFGCKQEPILWNVESTQQVISEYVDSKEEFSEFSKILESTGLSSLLAVRGPFTLFLPSDEQMTAYYAKKGVKSYTEFSETFLKDLALNHIIGSQIQSGDIGLGAIRDVNALGDYIVTEFQGADIFLNKESKIIKRDILASNGVVHHIDKVIEPITKSVYDVL
ncbi:MAG: fasciclin domain-containing protein, partial [Bacteroidales bacterium]